MSQYIEQTECNFETLAVRAGLKSDSAYGSVVAPISTSSIFVFKNGTERQEHMYSRLSNPNREEFENAVAECEGAKYGIAFSSGMAASSAVLHLLRSGDHIAKIDDLYAGTSIYIEQSMSQLGITSTSFTSIPDLAKSAMIPGKTQLVWIESPTNPTLKVTDIRAAADIAHANDCLLVVDNTFLSPVCQRPLALGADIVLHSVSKYINGHSDVVMGVLVTNSFEINERLQYRQRNMGATPSPFDCYLALRGMRTLALRMAAHCKNAMAVANFLEGHSAVQRVLYPGLKSHPQHNLSLAQAQGFGGMVTFYIAGGMRAATVFLRACKIAVPAVSLGAVETLVEHPASMTHADISSEDREALGISAELIRLSVGIEHQDDIIADLRQALDKAEESIDHPNSMANGTA